MIKSIEIPRNALQRFRQDGFVILKLGKEEQEVVRLTGEAALDFFRASAEEKQKGRLPYDLGYRGFAEEYSSSATYPDQVESFSASLKGIAAASRLEFGPALALYMRMLATINIFEPIAETVTKELAREITPEQDLLDISGGFRWWSFLQLNYSLPNKVTAKFINEAHEDGCLVTIASATTPGLEIQEPSGQFVPLTTAADEVLVMPGEIFWLLSGGAVRPLYHRVCPSPSHSERTSLLFFGDIAPELCRPWVANQINRNVDIGKRVLKNPERFGLSEWKP